MSQEFTISSGLLPGSEKDLREGEMFDIELPIRGLTSRPQWLTRTGRFVENERCRGLHLSGPYGRTTRWTCKGLPKIREQWLTGMTL